MSFVDRFTKPLRKAAIGFRKIRDDIRNTAKTTKGSAFSIFHVLRGLPIISTLADNLKRKFPHVWAKSRNKLMGIRQITQDKTIILATDQFKEDEQYFKNLFLEEIAKRKQQGL